jgi:tetratricopeptide (TPR) repeat protein
MKMVRWSATFLLLFFISLFFSQEALGQKWLRQKNNQVEIKSRNSIEAEKFFIEGQKYFILEDYPKAIGLFSKALELEPDNPAIHFKLAETHLRTGDATRALPYANKAVLLNDQNKYYHLVEAQVYNHLHRYDDAAATFENMIRKVEKTDEYLFQLVSLYMIQREYNKALDALIKAEQAFGSIEQVHIQKQRIYLKLDKVDEAIAEGKKLILANPGQPEYVMALVEVLNANGRHTEANELLSDVLKDDPDNYMALMTLVQVYQKSNDKAKARQYLIRAFENPKMDINQKVQIILDELQSDSGSGEYVQELAEVLMRVHPDDGITYAVYGDLLFHMKDLDNARKKYHKAIEFGENNFVVWQNVLQIELTLGEYENVVTHSDQALELYPNQAALYYFSGTARLIQKNYKEAIQMFEQGKRYASSNTYLLSVLNGQLGDAYHGISEHEKSDKAYEAALDANPDNDHALNNYSYYLALRKEKLDLAKKMSTKLIKNHPDNPNYLDTHAWVLYMLGEYEQARKVIEKAVKNNANGTIIEHYGDILYKLGDVEGAVKQWQRAKGMDESSELIDKKIADRKLYE